MIYLVTLCSLLIALVVKQRLQLISMDYRLWQIDQQTERMIHQIRREHNGMVFYDIMLKRLDEIKQHIKHESIRGKERNKGNGNG